MKNNVWKLGLLAGLASAASAQSGMQTSAAYAPADVPIGHIYYNVATGELIRTGAGSMRNSSSPIWVNQGYDQCGFAEWMYYPIRDSATGDDKVWVDWGDIQANSVVDCFTMLYFTQVADPEENGEEGFQLHLSFIDGYDGTNGDSCFCANTPYLTWEITGIPGSASGGAGWLVTMDFASTGQHDSYFEVGDADGFDDSANGLHSGYGAGIDIDADGLPDFGYAFQFTHPDGTTHGVSGCGLVTPPGATFPNALGVEDAFRITDSTFSTCEGPFNFGGYACTGSGFDWTPWASYYLGLYGGASDPDPCLADTNDDGLLDFFDVQIWLGWFSGGNPFADCNGDGVLDFFDVQCFLGQFSDGCP